MPDDYDGDGAPPSGRSDQGGKRRAPDPAEQPRRRRRSAEVGGLSVSDLVERHTGSRTDLPIPPAAGRRRAAEDEQAPDTGRRHAAPQDPASRHGGRDEFDAPAAPRHGSPTDGPSRRGAPAEPPAAPRSAPSRHSGPADAPPRHGSPMDRRAPVEGPARRGGPPHRNAPADDVSPMGGPSRHGVPSDDPVDGPPRAGGRRAAPEPVDPGERRARPEPPAGRRGAPASEPPPIPPALQSVPADIVRLATGEHRIPTPDDDEPPSDAAAPAGRRRALPDEAPPARRTGEHPLRPATRTGADDPDTPPPGRRPRPDEVDAPPQARRPRAPRPAGSDMPPPGRRPRPAGEAPGDAPLPGSADEFPPGRQPGGAPPPGRRPRAGAVPPPGPHRAGAPEPGAEAPLDPPPPGEYPLPSRGPRPANGDIAPGRFPKAARRPAGDDFPADAPAPGRRAQPTGEHAFPVDGPPPGRPNRRPQPTGEHGAPPPGQRPQSAQESGPPAGRRPQPTGEHPFAADGPAPGKRPQQPMGEHPFAPDGPPPGRRPQPTGQYPAPGPRPTGEHPLAPENRRPQPTGEHPAPAPNRRPGEPANRRPQPTGQYPAPGRPHPAEEPFPVDGPPTGRRPHPAEDPDFPADGPPPGRRSQQTNERPYPVDGPPTGRRPHPAAGDPNFPPGRRPHPAEDPAGPLPGRHPQPTGEHPFAADGPPPGRRPEQAPPMDGPAPGRRSQPTNERPYPVDGPPTGRRPHPAGDPDFPGDGPATGRRPHPAEDPDFPADGPPPGRRPQPTGQYPAPGPRPTGEHPLAPEGGRPQPTGQYPAPGRPPHPADGPRPRPDGGAPGPEIAQRLEGERPRIPRQQPPGQSSMPRGDVPPEETARVPLTPPPGVPGEELAGLTTEMEPIGEATQKRRRVDQTLARFSKVHDELKAEERAKRSRRMKLPWSAEDEELEEQLDELSKLPGEPTALVAPVEGPASEEAAPEEPDRERSRDRKPRKRKGFIARVFTGGTAALVFLSTGAGWGFMRWADDSIDRVRGLDPNSAAIQDAEGQRGDENFLLIGSDSREGAEAEEGVGDTNQVPGARSDTTMIAHVPADRSRVVIVSFPRDLEISRPDCERFDAKTNEYTGETVAGEENVRLNTAYQMGGPLCTTKVVQTLSGLKITRFIGIDFHGFKGMVEAVDGVNVCVEKPMFDTKLNKWIVQEAGKEVLLRGDQALDFVRARYVRGDPTSDYGRIKRQQRFLSSLLRKAMSGQVLLDPGKLTGFTQAFAESTFGDNINVDALFRLGRSLQGLEAGRVTFVTVPTVGTANSRGHEVLRQEDTTSLFRAIINNQPLPGEQPAAQGDGEQRALPQSAPLRQQQPSDQPVDPKTLKIQVLNGGNETDNIAGDTAERLAEFGYSIMQVNAGPPVPKTVVRYGKGNEAAARTLASSVPGAQLEESPAMAGALVLILGPEFRGDVVAPGTGGPPPPPAQEKLPEDLSTVNGGDVTCA